MDKIRKQSCEVRRPYTNTVKTSMRDVVESLAKSLSLGNKKDVERPINRGAEQP